jgi:SAM-dependent methyltransferase
VFHRGALARARGIGCRQGIGRHSAAKGHQTFGAGQGARVIPSTIDGVSREAFESVYRDGRWGFGSGHGSLPRTTRSYREFLEEFLVANGIESVVDYGCGDWQFSRLIDWHGASYVGVDIVPAVIERNRELYVRPGVSFVVTPDDPAMLPDAELLICKDVLQHLPNADVHSFLENVVPRFPTSLIINDAAYYQHELNREIKAGEWRPVDVRTAPFDADAVVITTLKAPKVHARSWRLRGKFNAGTKPVMLMHGR